MRSTARNFGLVASIIGVVGCAQDEALDETAVSVHNIALASTPVASPTKAVTIFESGQVRPLALSSKTAIISLIDIPGAGAATSSQGRAQHLLGDAV